MKECVTKKIYTVKSPNPEGIGNSFLFALNTKSHNCEKDSFIFFCADTKLGSPPLNMLLHHSTNSPKTGRSADMEELPVIESR